MSLSNSSLTSDFDYLKVANDNTVLITTGSPTDSDFLFPTDALGTGSEQGYATINHNLGAIPLVRAFIDPGANGLWYGSNANVSGTLIEPLLLTLVSTSVLKLCVNGSSHHANIPVYYRIYKPGTAAIDSDDRVDKIFSKQPGTSSVLGAAGSSSSPVQSLLPFAHNQNEPIIWTLQFSDDNAHWYNDGNFIYGPPDTSTGPPGGPYAEYYYMRAYASGDNNTFYVRLEHNYPASKTFYLRWSLDYRS